MSLKFSKKEKLKSRKAIQQLFQARQSIHVFPLRVIWQKMKTPLSRAPAQFAVSVPKRAFAKAVDRNRIKRIIREVYRLHKTAVYEALPRVEGEQFGLMFMYSGKREPTFAEIEKALKKLIKLFPKKMNKKSAPK
ncbi:MAG: ribonuclease P protein component [Bacteroidota bacterium]